MIDEKPPPQELERLRKLEETLNRMRRKNRKLAYDGDSLIVDYMSKGRHHNEPKDPNDSTH